MYADVIVDISADGLDRPFTYRVPAELESLIKPGQKVDIPFGAQRKTGFVTELRGTCDMPPEKVKDILGLSAKSVALEDKLMALAEWMHRQYGCTMNQALQTVLLSGRIVKKGKSRVEAVPLPDPGVYVKKELNTEQKQAVEAMEEEFGTRNRPCLLFGVTGSGKTEVYMELIEHQLQAGKQCILLIPEIGLTYQNLRRFYERFGERVGVINSRQSSGEKYESVRRAACGEIGLMIGPRSALFSPFPNLGLVIIDEEHDGAYHSDTAPRYESREVAEKLAALWGAGLVLGSATPSLESYSRTETGEVRLVVMRSRAVSGSKLPDVHIVDLRQELAEGNKSVFSRLLTEKITQRLENKEQAVLFLNRRGYAGFMSCRSCGKPLKCPHCDVSLKLHRGGHLRCHYCGYSVQAPDRCPGCGSPYIAAFGTGTQKVETLVQKAFPAARVLRMDADTTAGKGGHSRVLSAFREEEADILVGTQMIVKGHDFPKVTLVGIIAADMSLYDGDFRSAEETFSLLTQAAGRAGRAQRPGEVVIQTYMPDHYAITAAAGQDYEAFYREEMAFRRLLRYPPAGGLLSIVLTDPAEETAARMAVFLKGRLAEKLEGSGAELIGPVEGGISKVKDIYRQVLFMKHPSADLLRQARSYAQHLLGEHVQCDIR